MDDHEDIPVAVEWNPDLGAYAYFSGRSGWVIVPEEEMRIYAIRMERFFEQVFGNFDKRSIRIYLFNTSSFSSF